MQVSGSTNRYAVELLSTASQPQTSPQGIAQKMGSWLEEDGRNLNQDVYQNPSSFFSDLRSVLECFKEHGMIPDYDPKKIDIIFEGMKPDYREGFKYYADKILANVTVSYRPKAGDDPHLVDLVNVYSSAMYAMSPGCDPVK